MKLKGNNRFQRKFWQRMISIQALILLLMLPGILFPEINYAQTKGALHINLGSAAAGVEIQIDGISRGTADNNGKLYISDIVNGKHKIKIKKDGKTLLEFPQYTRPEVFEDSTVPSILTSGDHKKIENWRLEQALQNTKKNRPDML